MQTVARDPTDTTKPRTRVTCHFGKNNSVISMAIMKKGDNEIPGVTDVSVPRKYGPKRASRIRKMFNLSKEDDVRLYVIKT